jgi:hypothetical protein
MISLSTTLEMNLIAVWQSLHTPQVLHDPQCCLLWCADEAECDGELLAVTAQHFLLELIIHVMQNSVEVRDETSLVDLLPHFCCLLVDCIPLWMEYIVCSEDVDFILYMSPAETLSLSSLFCPSSTSRSLPRHSTSRRQNRRCQERSRHHCCQGQLTAASLLPVLPCLHFCAPCKLKGVNPKLLYLVQ